MRMRVEGKILFIDDDHNLLAGLRRHLRNLFNARFLDSPAEALEILKKENDITVIISDMRMPLMNGVELFEKAISISPNTIRIMLTGNADLQTAIDSVNRGSAFQFLVKPCETSVLKEAIMNGIKKYNTTVQLQKESVTDSLTSLLNHKYILDRFSDELEKAKRYKKKLSILMLDLDLFKSINDSYGHQVGDEVLLEVSKTLKQTVRNTDAVGRYGGEEFLVIFHEAGLKLAAVIAERIRKNVENITIGSNTFKVTISGGLIEYAGESAKELLEMADELLYKSKRGGRNCISCE